MKQILLGTVIGVLSLGAIMHASNRDEKDGRNLRLGNFSVSLAVKDLAKSQEFYEKLGFRVVMQMGPKIAIMQNDTATIGLFQGLFDKNIMTFNPGWDRTTARVTDYDDVREIQRTLKDRGVTLTTTTDDSATGPAGITLVDPDGNQILIDQHVPAPGK